MYSSGMTRTCGYLIVISLIDCGYCLEVQYAYLYPLKLLNGPRDRNKISVCLGGLERDLFNKLGDFA